MHKGKRRLSSNPKSFGYFSDSQDFELISKKKKKKKKEEAFTKTLNTLHKISQNIWIRMAQETQDKLLCL